MPFTDLEDGIASIFLEAQDITHHQVYDRVAHHMSSFTEARRNASANYYAKNKYDINARNRAKRKLAAQLFNARVKKRREYKTGKQAVYEMYEIVERLRAGEQPKRWGKRWIAARDLLTCTK